MWHYINANQENFVFVRKQFYLFLKGSGRLNIGIIICFKVHSQKKDYDENSTVFWFFRFWNGTLDFLVCNIYFLSVLIIDGYGYISFNNLKLEILKKKKKGDLIPHLSRLTVYNVGKLV